MSDHGDGGGETKRRPARPCPICGKPGTARHRPFCSRRCADIDLGRWFTEAYRIPGEPVDEGADETPPQPGDGGKQGG